MKLLISLLLICFSWQSFAASDLQREKRLKDQIIDAIFDGEALMLEADGHEFLSIYMEAEEAAGAVLIMHGRGYHPNWADAIYPLRTGLTEQGWNTLSIQMPVLDKQAKYYDYVQIFDEAVPRIEAAIEYLREQGNDKIIVLAHSCSVHMAMHYVRKHGDKDFDAFVGIGMGATDYKQPMKQPLPFEKINKPILDVFGSDDYPAVHRLAALRAQTPADNSHPLNEQKKIKDANHYFTDQGDALVEAVSEWLQKLE